MFKRIKNVLMSLSAASLLAVPVLAPAAVFADDLSNGLSCGANLNVSSITSDNQAACASDDGTDAGTRLDSIIKLVINIFSMVVGVIAVIMIIVGGLKYITSSGDSGNVTSAKNTILYAIIGLVVVALAQIIVRFVLNKATGNTTV